MIIALVGFAGSGKDTAGDMLVYQGFVRESFAKPVKDAVAAIFGWDRGLLEGSTSESRAWREQPDSYWSACTGKPFSPRLALQLMGTEAGRDVFHPNIWIDALEKRVSGNNEANYVITDVRFNNEIERLHRMGAIIVRVRRGPEPDYYDDAIKYREDPTMFSSPPASLLAIHRSEWDWIGSPFIDRTIFNDGSLHDLGNQITKLVDEHLPKRWD